MSSAADRNTRYCACTKYRVFLSADRANARTSRKPGVFEDALRKKAQRKMHCVFVKRVSDLGVTEMKRVLFVTSEAVPFIKTGGLADVAGSLPKYFSKNEYEVSVMLPKYMCIREDMRKKMHHILHFYVDLGWRKQYVGILEAKEDGIQYYFIDNEFYFAGERPYNNIYEDVEKFAFV